MTEKPTRNYKKENEWAKNKYKQIHLKLDKEVAEAFEKKLNGKPCATFIKEKIDEFLNE